VNAKTRAVLYIEGSQAARRYLLCCFLGWTWKTNQVLSSAFFVQWMLRSLGSSLGWHLQMTSKKVDFPLDEVFARAQEVVDHGHRVHQKFTCAACGQRLTMEEPNKFWTKGTCDKCGHVTDIRADGCNFLVVMSSEDSINN
jgi:predicted RNA-binding Zn-ribbon protein involved in translation (DUF1610 family)